MLKGIRGGRFWDRSPETARRYASSGTPWYRTELDKRRDRIDVLEDRVHSLSKRLKATQEQGESIEAIRSLLREVREFISTSIPSGNVKLCKMSLDIAMGMLHHMKPATLKQAHPQPESGATQKPKEE